MTATYPELLTAAHRKGDEVEVNRLLDVQASVGAEIRARINSCNDSIANVEHQLKAIRNLSSSAVEQEMNIADGTAPTLNIQRLIAAVQDWMER